MESRTSSCLEALRERVREILSEGIPIHSGADLKHTYGHRLRAAGVGFEDRKLLLGHKAGHVTTHYSAPEIGALIEASEKVCELGARKIHAPTLVGAAPKQQVLVSFRTHRLHSIPDT